MQQTQRLTSSPGSMAAGRTPFSSSSNSSNILSPRCHQRRLVHPDTETEMAEYDRPRWVFTRVPRLLWHWDIRWRLPVRCRTHLGSKMRSGTQARVSGDRENTLCLRVIPRFHQPLKLNSQLACGRKNVPRTLQGRSVKSAFLWSWNGPMCHWCV